MARKRKKHKEKPKQLRAGKPKPGRSPWAFKPRTVSRQSFLREQRKKFALLPLSKAYSAALRIGRIGHKNLPKTEKINFLYNDRAIAAKAVEGERTTAKNARRVLEKTSLMENMTPKAINDWVELTCNAIIEKQFGKGEQGFAGALSPKQYDRFVQKIRDQVSAYFKARKIPLKTKIEQDALKATLNSFLREGKWSDITSPLDLAWIEQRYLKTKRDFKGVEQRFAMEKNSLFAEVFDRERLTANQRRAAKRWMNSNYPKLVEEKLALGKKIIIKGTQGPIDENIQRMYAEFGEADQKFKEKAKKEVLKTFREKETPVKVSVQTNAQRKKLGTRGQRMAAYAKREKTSTEKKKELRKEEQKAEIAGKPFDSIAYALKEIAQESRQSGEFLKSLVNKGQLKRDSLIRLFTSGSLTQKVFQTVANDPEFKNKFGSNNIDRLARGLAYIGPKGRQTTGAKRAFQSEKGKKLFEFLARRGYIDTRHGKRMSVTYLARIR